MADTGVQHPPTLFVGGGRHGSSVEHFPGDAPAATWVDIVSGTEYRLTPVDFTTADAGWRRAQYTYRCWVYVHETIVGRDQLFTATVDAVTRWWFITTGVRSDASRLRPPPNGQVPTFLQQPNPGEET